MTTLKMALLAPIPSANDRMTTRLKVLLRISLLKARRVSSSRFSMTTPFYLKNSVRKYAGCYSSRSPLPGSSLVSLNTGRDIAANTIRNSIKAGATMSSGEVGLT